MKRFLAIFCVVAVLGSALVAEARIFNFGRRNVSVQRVVNDHCHDFGQVALRERVIVRDRNSYVEYLEVPGVNVVERQVIVERPQIQKIIVDKQHVQKQHVQKQRVQQQRQNVRVERVVEVERPARRSRSIRVEKSVQRGH